MLRVVAVKMKVKATDRLLNLEKELQKELYELRHPEMRELPSDVRAYNMYERAEVSSKAQFSTYKQQAKKQWINEMKVAECDRRRFEKVGTASCSRWERCWNGSRW